MLHFVLNFIIVTVRGPNLKYAYFQREYLLLSYSCVLITLWQSTVHKFHTS